MKKFFFYFLLCCPINFLNALEVACNFEEVYANGDMQQGFFLYDNSKLRYQYYDDSLYTIISTDNNFYLVNNFSKNVSRINENGHFLEKFIYIASRFPDIENHYNLNNSKIIIEKSSKNFIKRISIQSSNLNVSINFINCIFKKFPKKLFNHFNFEEFTY